MIHRIYTIFFVVFMLVSSPIKGETASELLQQGLECVDKDNFSLAMQYFTRSLEQAEQEGDSLTMMRSTGYIGNVYYNLYDYTRAVGYMLKGYTMAKNYHNTELQGSFLTNIVGVYCKMGNAEKAKQYFQLLEATPSKLNYNSYYYYVIYNKARIANTEGHTQEAIRLHQKALDWARDKQLSPETQLFQLCEIGQLLLAEGHYDQAISYGQRCISPARDTGELDLLTSVYKMMADAYNLKGDTTQEREYRRRYLALSDSLFNRIKISSADKELVEYEERQTSQHIDSLNGVITRQTMVIVAISLIGIIFVVFSLLLYRYNRKLRMAHRTLIDKNRELQKAESSRKAMLQQWLDSAPTTDEMGKNGIGMDKSQVNALLQRIIKAMDNVETISNPEFSLNMLADVVGSNTKYVSWVINDTYGKNFKTLLNEHRIHEACRRLSDPQLSSGVTIQAIYEGVGYTNAVSFIRAFKKVNGMTPSEYQRAMKSPSDD